MVQFFVFSDENEVILFYVFPKENEVTSFFVFSKENEREKIFPNWKYYHFDCLNKEMKTVPTDRNYLYALG